MATSWRKEQDDKNKKGRHERLPGWELRSCRPTRQSGPVTRCPDHSSSELGAAELAGVLERPPAGFRSPSTVRGGAWQSQMRMVRRCRTRAARSPVSRARAAHGQATPATKASPLPPIFRWARLGVAGRGWAWLGAGVLRPCLPRALPTFPLGLRTPFRGHRRPAPPWRPTSSATGGLIDEANVRARWHGQPRATTRRRACWPACFRHCTTDLLPSVEPPIGAPSGSGRPAVGMPSRCSSSRTWR